LIPSRVIFDVRMNADGSVNKYKARLVAQGNHQDSSTYFDTFADTASARTINIFLVLLLPKIWKSQQLILLLKPLFYTPHQRNHQSHTTSRSLAKYYA